MYVLQIQTVQALVNIKFEKFAACNSQLQFHRVEITFSHSSFYTCRINLYTHTHTLKYTLIQKRVSFTSDYIINVRVVQIFNELLLYSTLHLLNIYSRFNKLERVSFYHVYMSFFLSLQILFQEYSIFQFFLFFY